MFFLNGLLFATWVSRIPEARRSLGLDNGQLGLLLLAIAAGSLLSMPTSGALISRLGTTLVVRVAGLSALVGLVLAAVAIGRPRCRSRRWGCSSTASAPACGTSR